jgi:hypothetical protein
MDDPKPMPSGGPPGADPVTELKDLDTARMTLRWALERIRNLERKVLDLEKELQEERKKERSPLSRPARASAASSLSSILPRSRPFFAAAACTVMLAVAVVAKLLSPAAPEFKAYPVPFSHTTGLIAAEGKLQSVDWMNQQIFSIQPRTGRLLGTDHFPNPFITGLARTADAVWSADGESSRILMHKPQGLAVEKEWPAAGDAPAAMAADAESLWICESREPIVRRFRLPGLKLVSKGRLPFSPTAIWRQHDQLWLLDGDGLVSVLHVPELSLVRTTSYAGQFPPGAKLTGMAVLDGKLWISTENPPTVEAVALP